MGQKRILVHTCLKPYDDTGQRVGYCSCTYRITRTEADARVANGAAHWKKFQCMDGSIKPHFSFGIVAGPAFAAIRGLSCQVGAPLARAVAEERYGKTFGWARAMLSQIQRRG